MENIKSFEDACQALGIDPEQELSPEAMKLLTKDEIAYRKIKVITRY